MSCRAIRKIATACFDPRNTRHSTHAYPPMLAIMSLNEIPKEGKSSNSETKMYVGPVQGISYAERFVSILDK